MKSLEMIFNNIFEARGHFSQWFYVIFTPVSTRTPSQSLTPFCCVGTGMGAGYSFLFSVLMMMFF